MINLVLIPRYQSIGVAISTLLTECIVTGVQFYLVRKNFGFFEIVSISKKYWIAGAFMFFVIFLFERSLQPSFLHTILVILIGSILYFGILIFLHDTLIQQGWNKISELKNKLVR